jgi:hypothetical protein
VVAGAVWRQRARAARSAYEDIPLLVFPPSAQPPRSAPLPAAETEASLTPRLRAVIPRTEPADAVAWPSTGSLAPADGPAAAPDLEGTLQLLPGRLLPAGGERAGGQEIRFVRLPGRPRFTLGRAEGAAPSHIQLPAPTASRMHAYMEFEKDHWMIGNLSATNPVLVNGEPLDREVAVRLEDGDRLELGELAFIFRGR